jgi:uncharacterized protein YjlB
MRQINQNPDVAAHLLKDDGTYPNNSQLPLLVYKQAINLTGPDPADGAQQVLEANGWGGTWKNGIYDYNHYHSTSHEVLVVYCGHAEVQLGGDQGPVFKLQTGDMVVIPAGVAHKNLGQSHDFGVVGAYPQGQENYDMNYGKEGERPKTDDNIVKVPLPQKDPAYGADGPLNKYWPL